MLMIQLTGLSGAGKTSISKAAKTALENKGFQVEIIDGDDYRKTLCKDLGYSKEDRCENMRRLGKIAWSHVLQNKIAIIAAINPYEEVRMELSQKYGARTVWISCPLEILIERDTKGLYKKALLPDDHQDKIKNLTGVNDPYEKPEAPDLIINTHLSGLTEATNQLVSFILNSIENSVSFSALPLHTIQSTCPAIVAGFE